jgi:glycogen(starch) synthase
LRVSIVIPTIDRAASLRRLLDALRLQRHRNFEVIVVPGPCTDGTDALLEERAAELRVVRNEAAHLSLSRNLGTVAAAGELVAFIDDDAIPEPGWLDRMVEAFTRDDLLSVAGGFVRGPNGTSFQYRYSLCSRLGYASTHPTDPGSVLDHPGADPFRFIQGGNACFRREALREVGGFDEEIEFFHDETDLCARLLDSGHRLRVVPGADIIHRFEPSARRDQHGRMRDPFAIVKNQVYFVHRHALAPGPGRTPTPPEEAERELQRFADVWRDQARDLAARGIIGDAERDRLLERVEQGLAAGATAGRRAERATREIPPVTAGMFVTYPTLDPPAEGRRRVVFVSSEYAPGQSGGIARFTGDLARGLALAGWESHAIVPGAQPEDDPLLVDHPTAQALSRRMPRVILEDGVWVHRLPAQIRAPRITDAPVRDALDRAAAAFHGVRELEERFGPADAVSAPLWTADGLILSLDRRRSIVTTLMTSLRTVVGMHPSWSAGLRGLLALEGETLRHSRHLHAISAAVLDSVRHDYPRETRDAAADVMHLGVDDRRGAYERQRDDDGTMRILFVGRLERRKGVDNLLAAAVPVLRRHPEAELWLVGSDTLSTELGGTYRQEFLGRHADERGLLDRVRFVGPVTDDELLQHYADADVFVAPSRYESFGLVHVEAQMMGLPVVACATGGTPEVVGNGETGLLVGPEDAPALEAALERLVADDELRARLGAAARRRFEAQFTNTAASAATGAAYARLARADGAAEPDTQDIARRLGESIELVAAMPAHVAREIADGLLDPAEEDALAAVRRAWQAPDDVFVDELYRGILGREADPDGRAAFVAQLREGRDRGDLVRELGWSAEALALERSTDWLGELLELDGWTEERACAVAFAQRTHERFAQDITDLLVSEPGDRVGARELVAAELRAGASRVSAARRLLGAGFTVRNAPDFVGWEPMLGHLGGGTSEHATARQVRARVGTLVHRGRAAARRMRRSYRLIEQQEWRTTAIAEALGRVEAKIDGPAGRPPMERLDELLRQVVQGHASTGAMHERIWAALEQTMRKVDVVEHHATLRAETADERLRDVNGTVSVNSQRIDILQRKLEAMAIDLRDRLPFHPAPESLPEPQIPDRAAYEARLEAADDDVRVNLGAGEKPLDGYVNVDMRPLPGIDVVADVRRLPFEPASVAEFASAHLVEHFREQQLRSALLPYWCSLLRPGGTLRIVCPNWEEMTVRLADGRMTWPEFKLLTFGLQDYDGDDHFAMYTPESLGAALEAAGLENVEVLATDRMNGICPEMELTARRPAVAVEDRALATQQDRAG